jgi:hypothetical protein
MVRTLLLTGLSVAIGAGSWFTLNAQSVNITGSVVDNGTSAAIVNAKVTLVEFPACTTRTDANGKFTLSKDENTRMIPRAAAALLPATRIALSGNRLAVQAGSEPAPVSVQVFDMMGKMVHHEAGIAAGLTEFNSLWETPGLYYVKVQIGDETQIINSFGARQSTAIPTATNNSPERLAKIASVYTIEAGKSGYDSRQVATSTATGSAGTIRLSPWSQAPGTWKNVTPMANPDIEAVVCDSVRKSDCWLFLDYANQRNVRGVWKSTDYGVTWAECNTGTNGDQMSNGCPWYADLDHNPNRDPATPPTIISSQGYGSGGIWKSTDGGVSWAQIWSNNMFHADGTPWSVDNFMNGAVICGASGTDHLLASHHNSGYGIFETKDGGGTWKELGNTVAFNMGGHDSRTIVIDEKTWVIDLMNNGGIQRTTDGGVTWQLASGTMTPIAGRSTVIRGSTIYAGSQTFQLFKSSDKGASWKSIRGDWCGWVAASATRLYTVTSPGVAGTGTHTFRSALLSNDAVWDSTSAPDTKSDNCLGECAASTFDGIHYIILGTFRTGGIYRYVEP